MKLISYLMKTPFKVVKADIAKYRELCASERERNALYIARYDTLLASAEDGTNACLRNSCDASWPGIITCPQFWESAHCCAKCHMQTDKVGYHCALNLYERAHEMRRTFWAQRFNERGVC